MTGDGAPVTAAGTSLHSALLCLRLARLGPRLQLILFLIHNKVNRYCHDNMNDESSNNKAKMGSHGISLFDASRTLEQPLKQVEKVENNFESQRTIDTSRAETIGEEEGDQRNPPFLLQNKLQL